MLLEQRIAALDWHTIASNLDSYGCATVKPMLTPNECEILFAMYNDSDRFRSRIVMARYNFGQGEYKYFNHPLPDTVTCLRTALYPFLVDIANRWNQAMGIEARYPDTHMEFIEQCHDAGQIKPTPLLLRYGVGDYNCLHQDVYGQNVFPLQVVFLLSEPGKDFSGGEFVLTEQRPRMQSRVEVVPLQRGGCVIFPVRQRPIKGKRRFYRANMRHGVSRLHSGSRQTLGIIFHDSV